ncbi:MAG: aminoacyl-tRNA hydrolase [Ignavibacteria bacterium]|nr:aminoacyl-tRNA hydrolase [Ignavibacteria bacterium]
MIDETFKAKLEKEIKIKAVRSSGKGGQNVNKVSSKIELIFDVNSSLLLTEEQKRIILEKNITDKKGCIRITSQISRSQNLNKEDAIDKLMMLIKKSVKIPRKRLKTKPTKISKEDRLKWKKIISEKKKMRKFKTDET